MTNALKKHTSPVALIIDDDLSLRLTMGAALKKAGFSVLDAANGQEGLDMLRKESVDFIMLDVVMPGMDGYEVCREIRRSGLSSYVPVVMVTGLDDPGSIDLAFEAGADGFVTKPINWAMLGHRAKYMLRAGKAFSEVNRVRNRLEKTQTIARIGSWEMDLFSNTFTCSPEACQLSAVDYGDGEFTLEQFLESVRVEEREEVFRQICTALEQRRSFSVDYRVVPADGTVRYILCHGEVIEGSEHNPGVMLGVVQDVTRLREAEEEIRLLAFYDGLTGLANRMLFLDRLDQEILAAKRKGEKLALLYLDLDQFKRINDTLGHHYGDLLLKQVAEVLKRCIRGADTVSRAGSLSVDPVVARLGGDEFTILLSGLREPKHAAGVAQRILGKIRGPYLLEKHEISITTSIGISLYPMDGQDRMALLKHADTAMYHAKNSGRNNYQFHTKALNAAVVERFNIEHDIPRAMENDEFALYYQPKVEVKSGRIVGAEALIRWIHPERGMIPPDKFISVAEETGLITHINRWVFDRAGWQLSQWDKVGINPGVIAVNLSGYQLGQQNVMEIVEEGKGRIIDFSHLEVEITENILMQNIKENSRGLQVFTDNGVRVALDDFGTGYSSLSYLTSFKVDTLKIDRSFVMGCARNEQNIVVIKTIAAMGHSLGHKIVAEGVETREELKIIYDIGIDEAQGFYFSPPVSADEFAELVAANTVYNVSNEDEI